MSYRLLVLDWDGTVMDSAGRIVACVHETIADLGLEPRSRAEISHIIGLSLGEAIDTLYPGRDAAFHERMIAGYRRRYLAAAPASDAPFPGVADALAALSDAGYLLGVATGKSRAGLQRGLRESGYDRYFHASRCADDAPSKPHPGMLEQLMDELGATPAETLMVGDTVFDLEMARNAGAGAVAVACGAHPRARLAAARPDALLDDLGALPDWLVARAAVAAAPAGGVTAGSGPERQESA